MPFMHLVISLLVRMSSLILIVSIFSIVMSSLANGILKTWPRINKNDLYIINNHYTYIIYHLCILLYYIYIYNIYILYIQYIYIIYTIYTLYTLYMQYIHYIHYIYNIYTLYIYYIIYKSFL